MNKSIPDRNLNSNLWVWYPTILSLFRSFHHNNLRTTTNSAESMNLATETFILAQSTMLVVKENREAETIKGQKDDCTAKNGDFRKLSKC